MAMADRPSKSRASVAFKQRPLEPRGRYKLVDAGNRPLQAAYMLDLLLVVCPWSVLSSMSTRRTIRIGRVRGSTACRNCCRISTVTLIFYNRVLHLRTL